MALVEMTHLGVEAERAQQAPAADAEHQLLLQPQLRAAAVQLAGDAAHRRGIGGIVAVEQVERGAPDARLPGAHPDAQNRAARY